MKQILVISLMALVLFTMGIMFNTDSTAEINCTSYLDFQDKIDKRQDRVDSQYRLGKMSVKDYNIERHKIQEEEYAAGIKDMICDTKNIEIDYKKQYGAAALSAKKSHFNSKIPKIKQAYQIKKNVLDNKFKQGTISEDEYTRTIKEERQAAYDAIAAEGDEYNLYLHDLTRKEFDSLSYKVYNNELKKRGLPPMSNK